METNDSIPEIEIPLPWKPVQHVQRTGHWHNGPPLNASEREKIAGPRVYQWVLNMDSTVDSVYIGESGRFQVRLGAYRKPGPIQNEEDSFIRAKLRAWVDHGGSVELQFLDFGSAPFRLNGARIDNASLGNHHVRLMLENVSIVAAKVKGIRVLNRLKGNVYVREINKLGYPKIATEIENILKARGGT